MPVTGSSTRDALLERGALLLASRGIDGVTARQLHEAIGTRNESALHYHFGGKQGLVKEILAVHFEAVEQRRARLVAAIAATGATADLRALVHALAAPMAADLDNPIGRAHLRIVGQSSHPAMAYESAFRLVDAPAGMAVARWLREALAELPEAVRAERFAALRVQLVALFAQRARLLDDRPDVGEHVPAQLYLQNVVDMLVAGLAAEPSAETASTLPG